MSCYQYTYSYILLKKDNWVLLFSDDAPWPNGKAHNLKVVILIGKENTVSIPVRRPILFDRTSWSLSQYTSLFLFRVKLKNKKCIAT